MKRLVLVDGFAIIHRAYHAFPPLTTPDGQLVNAVYGFTLMLLQIVDALKPDYLAVAYDLPVPTFRHVAYVAYQATRPYADDKLTDQVGLVREVVESAGIPVCSAPGYEADDVIGTIAKQITKNRNPPAGRAGQKTENRNLVDEVVVVTGDRDMLQLVSDKIKVYMPIKGLTEARLFDKNGVKEYLGIIPEEIVDYKALIGDASDNYPGVPGIGPKTAISLLQKFGSLEGIYKAIEKKKIEGEASPKIIEKLIRGYKSAKLSKHLATIERDVPLTFNLEDAKLSDLKEKKEFIEKLKEFKFKSLLARLGVETILGDEKKKKSLVGNGQMGLV